MMKYHYEIEFIDEGSGQSFITDRIFDHEAEWDEIWQEIVHSGDLQMVPHLVSVEDDYEDEDN
jgi:hypothetical protein